MGVSIVLAICLTAALSLAILWREGLLKSKRRIAAAFIFVALAFAIRALCMNHETLDYIHFLSKRSEESCRERV